jgi:hypothetical protein
MTTNWFDVDKDGLCKQAKERGPAYILVELIANALDERPSGVTNINVVVEPIDGKPYAGIIVEDNSERGYGEQFNNAWTLFAESYKRKNPTQSGQFNLGCKLWLSLCQSASIETTTGTVIFNDKGRKVYPRRKRESGTVVKGTMYLKRDDFVETERLLNSLILPDDVTVTFNGKQLQSHKPIHTFEETLATQKPDEDGVMRPTARKTTISVYEVREGEEAMLYELGIPVVESPCNWHINIGQKVPLNKDRDNVTPAYSRKIKTHVANNMRDDLTSKDGKWAQDVYSDPDAQPETINKILDETEGKKRVVYDPSDLESNVRGPAEGYTVMPGNRYTKDQWAGIRRANEAAGGKATPPAGQMFPTPQAYSDDPNADPAHLIPESKWTPAMRNAAEFSKWVAIECLNVRLTVNFVKEYNDQVLACYSRNNKTSGSMDFNMKVIGRSHGNTWFDKLDTGTSAPIETIVHELSHHWIGSHFNRENNGRDGNQPGLRYFYDATGRVGVRLAALALREPDKFRNFLKAK